MDANVDELMTRVKELKESLEEKCKEADEYLDKYCSLLISHEKLERAKEMLETQVARLSSQPSTLSPQSSPVLNSLVPGSSPVPPVTEKNLPSGQSKASGKRQRSTGIRENGGGTAPSTPETFSKRSKKVVKSGIHPAEAAEDCELEPEGLPEVVKKGVCVFKQNYWGSFESLHKNLCAKRLVFRYCVAALTELQKQWPTFKLVRYVYVLSAMRE